jgi:hypothetical protein
MLQITFLVSLESSEGGGVHGLVSRCLDLQCRNSQILNGFFPLKIKLNHDWKFQRNWNVLLVLLERSWWARFNGIHLVRFGFRMWEVLIFKRFLPLRIKNKFQKTRFWEGKIRWGCANTWTNGTGHTSSIEKTIWSKRFLKHNEINTLHGLHTMKCQIKPFQLH